MSTALVHISRPDYELDKINLKFNQKAFEMIANKALMFEETKQGLLLTVPSIDHHKSTRVHKKRKLATTDLFEDFNEGQFVIKELDKETFLIEMFDE